MADELPEKEAHLFLCEKFVALAQYLLTNVISWCIMFSWPYQERRRYQDLWSPATRPWVEGANSCGFIRKM